MTPTPCNERTPRRDALPCQNALVFYAKIPPCAAGRSVECMALGVVTGQVRRIRGGSTGGAAVKSWNCGALCRLWAEWDRLKSRTIAEALRLPKTGYWATSPDYSPEVAKRLSELW